MPPTETGRFSCLMAGSRAIRRTRNPPLLWPPRAENMGSVFQDVRYSLRMLRKHALFTAIIVLTLALGIGANTALFSMVDAILLRPLPFNHPEELVALKEEMPGVNLANVGLSQPELDDLQKRCPVFQQVSVVWPISAMVALRWE